MRLFRNTRRRFLCLCVTLFLFLTSFAGCLSAAAAPSGDDSMRLRITASVEGRDAEVIQPMLENGWIDISTGNKAPGTPLLNVTAVLAGMDVFKLLVEGGSRRIAFSLPLSDTVRYEIDAAKLIEVLDLESILSGAAGQESVIPSLPASGQPQIEAEEYLDALSPYVEILGTHLSKCTTTKETELPFEKLDAAVRGSLSTCEPDAEILAALMDDLADQMEQDEKMDAIIEKWAAYLREVDALTGVSDDTLSYEGLSGEGSVPEDLSAEVPASDEMSDEAASGGGLPSLNDIAAEESLPISVPSSSETEEESLPIDAAPFPEAAGEDPAGMADQLEDGWEKLPGQLRDAAKSLREEGMGDISLTLQWGAASGRQSATLFNLFFGSPSAFYKIGYESTKEGAQSFTDLFFETEDPMAALELSVNNSRNGKISNGVMTFMAGGSVIGSVSYNWDSSRRSELGAPFGTAMLSFGGATALFLVSENNVDGTDHMLRFSGLDRITGDPSFTGFSLTVNSQKGVSLEKPSGTVQDLSDYSLEELQTLGTELVNKITQTFFEVLFTGAIE